MKAEGGRMKWPAEGRHQALNAEDAEVAEEKQIRE
jgi:hypothetical protein